MTKRTMLKTIRATVPSGILIEDSTDFDFSEDEFVALLSWISYFNVHFSEFGFSQIPKVQFPVVSRRITLDFGLYNIPVEDGLNKGCNVVYINKSFYIKDNLSLKEFISRHIVKIKT